MSDASHTIARLTEIATGPLRFVLEGQTVHFATDALEAERTGFALQRFAPNAHPGLGHRHEHAEEIYVVIAGSGRIKLDERIFELERLDAVRVAPQVWRAFSAGPEGMEMLAFGDHHVGDGEAIEGWWPDDRNPLTDAEC